MEFHIILLCLSKMTVVSCIVRFSRFTFPCVNYTRNLYCICGYGEAMIIPRYSIGHMMQRLHFFFKHETLVFRYMSRNLRMIWVELATSPAHCKRLTLTFR